MKTPFVLIIFCSIIVFGCKQKENELKFKDAGLSFEERVIDLVSRMTLEEKVAQMNSTAPSIPG